MDRRNLGRSGLEVSRLCLGSMMFGGAADESTSRRIIHKARDQGINFIDTADVYGGGNSELTVGAAIAEHRDDWVLATKFGNPMGSWPNQGGQSRKWIVQSLESSLKRLGTDYVDIMYIHRSLGDESLPEAIRALGDLIRQGKIRYFGVSNFAAWRLGFVCQLAERFGMDPPVASQPLYNLADRSAEREHLPAAYHYGVGIVSYSPLARGVLTAKYATDAPPDPTSRAGRNDMRMMQTEWRPESIELAQEMARHAAGKGMAAADFALAWVLANRRVTSVIAGPRTEEQWDAYVRAAAVELDVEDEAFVDQLVAPGHISTHGFNDPAYPVEGRVTS